MKPVLWPVIDRQYVGYVEIKFVTGICFHCGKCCYWASAAYCWLFTPTALDGNSGRRTDLYLTTHNTHIRHPYFGGIRNIYRSKLGATETIRRPRGQTGYNVYGNMKLNCGLWSRLFVKCWLNGVMEQAEDIAKWHHGTALIWSWKNHWSLISSLNLGKAMSEKRWWTRTHMNGVSPWPVPSCTALLQ
jgi:hypothetical protein